MEAFMKIISVIVSAAVSATLSGMTVWYRMRKKKDSAIADGVQCLLREKIIEKHAKYVEEKHFCPIYAKESLRKAYNAYHALGGNGDMNDLRRTFRHLPTVHGGPPTEVSENE